MGTLNWKGDLLKQPFIVRRAKYTISIKRNILQAFESVLL